MDTAISLELTATENLKRRQLRQHHIRFIWQSFLMNPFVLISYIDRIINEDLSEVAPYLIGKVLGTVYRSIGQDNYNGRGYIEFIHQYVGVRVATGVRALASPG